MVGKDKPIQFVKDVARQAAGNIGSMMTTPGLAMDMLSDSDRFGKQRDIGEKITRTIPLARIMNEAFQGTKDYGPAEGAKRLVEEATGTGFASVTRRGSAVLDAGLQERVRAVKDA